MVYSETRFFELSKDLMCIARPDGYFLRVNDAFMKVLGYDEATLLEQPIMTLIHPDDVASSQNALEKINQGEPLFSFENRYRCADNSYKWVEWVSTPAEDGAIYAIGRDITHYKQIQTELRQSEARYRAIVESQIDLICMYTLDARLTYVNDAYCHYFNKTRDELIGQSYLTLVETSQHGNILRRLEEIQHDPSPDTAEYMNVMSDGHQLWVQWVDHGITDETGRVVLVQAVGRDITPLKEAEEEIKRQEELYRMLFERNPVPMWVTDSETFRILAVNEAAVQQYGYTHEEFVRMTSLDLRLPKDVPAFLAALKDATVGLTRTGIWRHRRKDGSVFDAEIITHDVVMGGRPARIVLANDITSRQELEMERVRARTLEVEMEKERELIALREHFISMVSHEFRTPLTVIQSSVDIVGKYMDKLSPERIREKLEAVRLQIRRMARLLDDVLALSRASAGKLEVRLEEIDLVDFCSELVENARLADHEQHPLFFETPLRSLSFNSDRRLLEHIFTNLLSNALKYSPPGQPVYLSLMQRDHWLMATVRDSGIGIPSADVARLFTPFARASNAEAIPGTGLGLAIVKQSAEALGGSISCESREGRGTLFRVELPLEWRFVEAK